MLCRLFQLRSAAAGVELNLKLLCFTSSISVPRISVIAINGFEGHFFDQ